MGSSVAQDIKLPVEQRFSKEIGYAALIAAGSSGVLVATLPEGDLEELKSRIVQTFDGSAVLTVGDASTAAKYQDSGDITEGSTGFNTDIVASSIPAAVSAGHEIRVYLASGTPTQGKIRVSGRFFSYQSTDPSN